METRLKVNPLLDYINWRIAHNKNLLAIVNGSTGSGKTYAALKLAEQISESQQTNFSVADNVAFSFEDMLKKMQLPQNDKPGSVFLFEEVGSVGSGSSAKEWQSSANRLFSSFMQTSRCLRQVLIMTTPSFSFLDNSSRKMIHIQLIMKKINFQNKHSYAKPYLVTSDARIDKLYFKYLRFPKDGRMLKLSMISFKLPKKEILVEYEREKTRFVRELNEMIMKEFEEKRAKKETKQELNQELEKQKEQMVDMYNQGMSSIEIAVRLGCSQRKVQYYLKEKQIQKEMAQELPNLNKKQGTGWVLDVVNHTNVPI